jgi:hypothetical protein
MIKLAMGFMKYAIVLIVLVVVIAILILSIQSVFAANSLDLGDNAKITRTVNVVTADCLFTTTKTTMKLENDCTTDQTILIPDGFTLDGKRHTITAVDPSGGHFVDAVIKSQGATAHVKNLIVTTSNLNNVCDAGEDRLRGIMFEGASGSIIDNKVLAINQGASGCQEGNAIEVRNAPFDGTHPNTMTVEIAHNTVSDYQKTGIVSNGDVSVSIHHNKISSSATQVDLAANSIQFGFGAAGTAEHNKVDGNQWCGSSDSAATAILIFDADNVQVIKNDIGGNSDIGIYIAGDDVTVDENKVIDSSAIDCNQFGYDIGIGNYGENNSINKNKVSGFDMPFDGDVGEKNKEKKAKLTN